ncbi:MAG: hypothetical protein JST16_08480 [Bdellovibrionales bacterium]|nr:hypothetical protein [Bdellovibrionales bacterium]
MILWVKRMLGGVGVAAWLAHAQNPEGMEGCLRRALPALLKEERLVSQSDDTVQRMLTDDSKGYCGAVCSYNFVQAVEKVIGQRLDFASDFHVEMLRMEQLLGRPHDLDRGLRTWEMEHYISSVLNGRTSTQASRKPIEVTRAEVGQHDLSVGMLAGKDQAHILGIGMLDEHGQLIPGDSHMMLVESVNLERQEITLRDPNFSWEPIVARAQPIDLGGGVQSFELKINSSTFKNAYGEQRVAAYAMLTAQLPGTQLTKSQQTMVSMIHRGHYNGKTVDLTLEGYFDGGGRPSTQTFRGHLKASPSKSHILYTSADGKQWFLIDPQQLRSVKELGAP